MTTGQSLWRDGDFLKLWLAKTAATFGALMGALQLTAILVLDASPAQMAGLGAATTAPALAFGLLAGAWVDRIRRRPVLVVADLVRAVSLGSVPLAYFLDALTMPQLYAVAFINGSMAIFFEVAHPSYVPSVVGRSRLIDANSRIHAAESVVESVAFSAGGWIAQLVSAIAAVTVNTGTFVVSGLLLLSIRRREPPPADNRPVPNLRAEVVEGLRFAWSEPLLRAILVSRIFAGLGFGVIGGLITLFALSEIGFAPGPLGMIYGVGGISSFAGAVLAPRVSRRFGIGPAMAWGFTLMGLLTFLIPLAPAHLVVATIFFVIPQLFGDGGWTVHEINEVSLRQAVTPDRVRGRVNSAFSVVMLGSQLLGALVAGVAGETLGLRWALGIGAGFQLGAGLWLLTSKVRTVRETPPDPDQPVLEPIPLGDV